jgi:hypothetical protein
MRNNIRIDNLNDLAQRIRHQLPSWINMSISQIRDEIVSRKEEINHLTERQIVETISRQIQEEWDYTILPTQESTRSV